MADTVSGAVAAGGAVRYVGGSEKKSSGTAVDTETFLKLLVAQLQYQDPLEPQTDTQFVTQLAQMTSLEQMQQMNATLSNSQAYDMIGKTVYAEVLNEQTGIIECYAGLVDSIVFKENIPYVVLGGYAVAASKVLQVFNTPEPEPEPEISPEPSPEPSPETSPEPEEALNTQEPEL